MADAWCSDHNIGLVAAVIFRQRSDLIHNFGHSIRLYYSSDFHNGIELSDSATHCSLQLSHNPAVKADHHKRVRSNLVDRLLFLLRDVQVDRSRPSNHSKNPNAEKNFPYYEVTRWDSPLRFLLQGH